MPTLAVVPAFQAARTLGAVVEGLFDAGFETVWVIDDGSTDATAEVARRAGARVVSHPANRGKGAALRTALELAQAEGVDALVALDADGQHIPAEAARLDGAAPDRSALVLGVRDLTAAGAPTSSRVGNAFSTWSLSTACKRPFRDTQCGLRRYPVAATLALGAPSNGFAFESDVILRAALTGLAIVEVPIDVRYPPDRTSHYRGALDSIVMTLRLVTTFVRAKRLTRARAHSVLHW